MQRKAKKPRVLFLVKWYPNKNDIQSGIFIQRHAEAISQFAEVSVLYAKANLRDQNKWIVEERSVENGVTVLRFYYKKRVVGFKALNSFIKFMLYFLCCLRGYRQMVSEGGPFHLLHVHVLGRTALFALYLRMRTKLPLVVSEHWTGYLSPLPWFRRWYYQRCLHKCEALLPVTAYLAKNMAAQLTLPSVVEIVPNVVDQLFFEKEIQKHINPNQKMILQISDLVDKHKNLSGLLNALHLLKEKRNDFRLVLIGDGKDKAVLQQKMRQLDLDQQVQFVGLKSAEQIADYMQKSCFLTLFSHYETFGVVLIEALAMGTPVVVSDLPAFDGFINENNARRVPIDDVDALAVQMDFMLDNYSNYDPQHLRAEASAKFSYQHVALQIERIYRQVLSSSS